MTSESKILRYLDQSRGNREPPGFHQEATRLSARDDSPKYLLRNGVTYLWINLDETKDPMRRSAHFPLFDRNCRIPFGNYSSYSITVTIIVYNHYYIYAYYEIRKYYYVAILIPQSHHLSLGPI
jgi:hypothetical protein